MLMFFKEIKVSLLIGISHRLKSETVLPTTLANGCISANRVPDPDTIVVEMQDDTRIAGIAK